MVDRSSQNKQGAGRWQSRFNLSRLAISYPRLTIGFWIAVTVAGLISFGSLKYALFPDITFPVVLVSANGPTTTALATESQITTPIETSLKAVPDLVDVSSSSFSGQSVVRLSFATGSSLTQAEQDVKAAIAQADLPNDVETGVTPFNLNEASIISYAVVSDGPSRQVIYDRLQTGVVPDLEVVPGVLRVEVLGAADLETQQPSAADESAAAVGINLDSPTLVQFNGEDALAIRVIKDANANTLDVVQAIEAKVAELDIQGATLELAATQAQFIREATQSTIDALQLAIVLAVVIIYFFLWSFRATLITALAIPISLLGTCIVMALFNFNLETITLLALALVIGIVVDDAIVDVENIARHIEAGDPPREAALKATTEIGLTVSASTLTIVAVFLPIGLMHGTIGQFFKPFGLTVSAAVLISLLVARTLSPVLAVYWLRPKQNYRLETFHDSEFEATPAVSAAVGAGSEQRDFWANVTEWYKRFLSASLDHRNWVIVLAIAAFAAGIGLFPLVPKGFIPKLDRGSFNVIYTVDPSTLSQDVETAIADQIQAQLQGQAAGTGTTYTVQPGDTLDRIAAQTLGDPNLGPAIAQANQLQDPGALEVGQVLQIPPANLAQGGLPNDQAAAQEALANLPQPNEAEITRISLQQSEPDAKEIAAAVLTNTNVQSVLSVIGAQGAVNQGRLAVTLRDDRTEHTATVQDAVRQALPTIPNVAISVEDIQPVDTGSEKPLKVAFKGNNLNDLITTVQTVKQSIEQDPGFVDITATGDNEPETSP
ncbi:MAG: efflux RND transporter permease subunit, partial [Cyanobacteria bacterium P01_H01_bin.121]